MMNYETKRDVFEKALREWNDLVHSCGLQGEEAHGGCEFDPILIKYNKDYDAALPDDMPVISVHVATYIEWCKKHNAELREALYFSTDGFDYVEQDEIRIGDWIAYHQEAFARAWLDGYEVEK
ncbi:DUF1642 domain-containing protein [Lapidilactobacillus bayanensis]|uniref:DUF1642 domain-containing protein n=1 Tax=Lapidilactobacillus bayanensis TaxID=2485998 RepID=UPI001CDCB440|nr:DUF1642 domain-containing protein [Lapidilactobacillus bayanensis]